MYKLLQELEKVSKGVTQLQGENAKYKFITKRLMSGLVTMIPALEAGGFPNAAKATRELIREAGAYIKEIGGDGKLPAYEVVVGNIGSVYSGPDANAAMDKFLNYREQSQTGYGRAGGEDVTLLEDGEIIEEYEGRASDDSETA